MTEKCVLTIELPIDDFIVSNSHGITCEVSVVGRDRDNGPYVTRTFDASSVVKQTRIETKK